MLAIRAACTVADVYSVLDFSEVWWVGRKFSRASSARVDLEGSFELQGCLAEAWLVKEAAAILLASWIPDGRSPLKSVNLHTWLHALSHKSTTCVIRIQSIQTWDG